MEYLEDIIRYENEGKSVDFKKSEYVKENYTDLLRDIISMANADTLDDRHIIIGVKHYPDGKRDILGIKDNKLTDSATYQQLVYDNIEPEIHFDYMPYRMDGKTFGIFKITNCTNQPYLMKKDKQPLKRGEGYIRVGSSQRPLTRADLDRIYAKKQKQSLDINQIKILSLDETVENEILLEKIRDVKLPSDIEKEKIKRILADKKSILEARTKLGLPIISEFSNIGRVLANIQGKYVSYEDRSINELEEDLSNIKRTYSAKDCYYIFEEKSNKVNFKIKNCSTEYIEDVTIIMKFPFIKGVLIATQIYNKPNSKYTDINSNIWYPKVEKTESEYIIESNISNIKHGLSTKVFGESLRIVVSDKIEIAEFEVKCYFYGKNIDKPINKTLTIKIK